MAYDVNKIVERIASTTYKYKSYGTKGESWDAPVVSKEAIPTLLNILNEELAERNDMSPEDFDDCWRYACKMPEDNQECLITTSVWGYVVIDTFHIDEDGAMYFENHEDEDEVLAWMPLPEPYTKEETT